MKRSKRLGLVALVLLALHALGFTVGQSTLSAQSNQVPKYQVIHTKDEVGVARLTEYYVLIGKVDLGNESFKKQIKAIISELANKEGKPEFQARIFQDKEVLEYEFDSGLPDAADYISGSDEDVFRKSILALGEGSDSYNDAEMAAYKKAVLAYRSKAKRLAKNETALVASYTGGFDYDTGKESQVDSAYSILWFGRSTKRHPLVGKYTGDEQWKPAVTASAKAKDSECFIATAAYGTPLADDIDVLREFRDGALRGNPAGRSFIAGYYQIGPVVADFIDDRPLLRAYVREFYIKPVVRVLHLGH